MRHNAQEYDRDYFQKNKEKIYAKRRLTHPPKPRKPKAKFDFTAYFRIYRPLHRDLINARTRKYYASKHPVVKRPRKDTISPSK